MSDSVNHTAYVVEGTVHLANDDDSFYVQVFHDWSEINAFVAHLRDVATEAFGKEPT